MLFKGSYWAVHPNALSMFENGSCLRRRKRFKVICLADFTFFSQCSILNSFSWLFVGKWANIIYWIFKCSMFHKSRVLNEQIMKRYWMRKNPILSARWGFRPYRWYIFKQVFELVMVDLVKYLLQQTYKYVYICISSGFLAHSIPSTEYFEWSSLFFTANRFRGFFSSPYLIFWTFLRYSHAQLLPWPLFEKKSFKSFLEQLCLRRIIWTLKHPLLLQRNSEYSSHFPLLRSFMNKNEKLK